MTLTNEDVQYLYTQADKKRSSSKADRLDFRQDCAENAIKYLHNAAKCESIRHYIDQAINFTYKTRSSKSSKKIEVLPGVVISKNQIEVPGVNLEEFVAFNDPYIVDTDEIIKELLPILTTYERHVVNEVLEGVPVSKIAKDLKVSRQTIYSIFADIRKRAEYND